MLGGRIELQRGSPLKGFYGRGLFSPVPLYTIRCDRLECTLYCTRSHNIILVPVGIPVGGAPTGVGAPSPVLIELNESDASTDYCAENQTCEQPHT